ncbi:hypothetical protein ACXWPN_10200, partial [Streptococcus pyogenes]
MDENTQLQLTTPERIKSKLTYIFGLISDGVPITEIASEFSCSSHDLTRVFMSDESLKARYQAARAARGEVL